MSWLSLSITCPDKDLNDLKMLLENFGATSISFTQASEDSMFDNHSQDIRFWEMTRATALLDPDIDIDIVMACIRNRIGTENIRELNITILKDRDWESSIKSGFGPVIIENTLCICPSWSQPPANIPYTVLMDPGLAFGTGTHETTAMCLEWLVSSSITSKRIVDFGCGSGILGIAAIKLGAGQVIAVDIDPQATLAAVENAGNNGVKSKMSICSRMPDNSPPADIVIANILLEPLLRLAEDFYSYLRPQGEVVLSGLLANQVEAVLDCYDRRFEMSPPVFKNEWALLTGVKNTS